MTARKRKLRPREMAKLWPSAAMVFLFLFFVVWCRWRKGWREGGTRQRKVVEVGGRRREDKKKEDNRGRKKALSRPPARSD